MIAQILDYLGNHYFKYSPKHKQPAYVVSENMEMVFDETDKTITFDYEQTYKAGQYIMIFGSDLNDGVYKISSVDTGILTVEETLQDETETCYIFPLSIPNTIISLNTRIEAWITSYGNKNGIASESVDDYSVSFNQLTQIGGFKKAFSGDLMTYRDFIDDFYEWKRYNGY